MSAPSLARRFFVLAAAWSAASLLVAGLVLVAFHRATVEQDFDDRLIFLSQSLVTALADRSGPADVLRAPDDLGEPRFDRASSGWYWVVLKAADRKVALASRSLSGELLHLPSDAAGPAATARQSVGETVGPDGRRLRVFERLVDFDGDTVWRIAVAGDTGPLDAEVARFRFGTAIILALVGLGSIAAVLLEVRLALSPLERMRRTLARIRTGEVERLAGDVPVEIAPLARELDALIEADREAAERARTHVGNLAHALKTPLAVLLNEARGAEGPLAAHVVEQVEAMREQVGRHLDRARIAAQRRVVGVVTEVEPVVDRLVRAMRRIHGRDGVEITASVAPGLRFRGEQEDLEEALGNLVDNACKWSDGRVDLSIAAETAASGRPMLVMLVDDDGPGLPPESRAEALRRGRRLDETVPGSGLGLSIVAETAALYAGSLELETSPLGGLRCRLRLPAL